jgi:hypothetical protein
MVRVVRPDRAVGLREDEGHRGIIERSRRMRRHHPFRQSTSEPDDGTAGAPLTAAHSDPVCQNEPFMQLPAQV